MRLIIAPAALADLDDLYDYLASQAGERIAQSHAEDFRAAFERLLIFPDSGKPAGHYRPGLREIPTLRYRVFYQHRPGTVEIVRILHERRDIRPEMFQ